MNTVILILNFPFSKFQQKHSWLYFRYNSPLQLSIFALMYIFILEVIILFNSWLGFNEWVVFLLILFTATGDVPVCDPRKLYECVVPTQYNFVRDNAAQECNCRRQCHRLLYHPTVSQSLVANSVAEYFRDGYDLNGTLAEITLDYCIVEVGISVCFTHRSVLNGHSLPFFGPCLLWSNGWMDHDATWYGDSPRPMPHCIRWGHSFPPPPKGAQEPPLYGRCLLWLTTAHLSYCWALVIRFYVIL